MDLRLLHFILDLVNDGSRITLNKDSLRMKFLSGIDDARPGNSKLGFRDRRLEETKASGRKKFTIRIPDNIFCATLGTPNTAIKIDLDKS